MINKHKTPDPKYRKDKNKKPVAETTTDPKNVTIGKRKLSDASQMSNLTKKFSTTTKKTNK